MKKIQRSYIREILDATNEKIISFAGGLPNEDLFPIKELESASKKVFKNKKCLQYTKSQGLDELREIIASFYTNILDFKTSKDEILITSGSQQAFDLILKSLDKEEIIVEEPSYIGALSAFKILDFSIKGFKKIDELDNMLNNKNILYTISDYQNPSTHCYSNKERKEIAKFLNNKKSILIEDGAYTFLNFKNKIKKPISKYCDNSYHLGSFSKIIAPGLRVGWIRTNKKKINNLLAIKESADLHTSTFSQMLLENYLKDNDIFNHIFMINSEYKNKMLYMAKCFEKYIPSFKFKKPKGGMFIYGSFDIDSMFLAKKAIDYDITFVPAEVFYINQKSKEARFNFTNAKKSDIKKGIKKLGLIIEEIKNDKLL